MKYTIQVFYDAEDDKRGKFRAETPYHVEAPDIGSAYAQAEKDFASRPGVKFGYIIPGHHNVLVEKNMK